MAKQPKNITNNNVTLAPFNIDMVKNKFTTAIENMTHEDIIDGQSGVARIVAPCLTDNTGKKMIKCNDASRCVFTAVDEYGNIIKDIKARKIANVIEPIASAKIDKIIEDDELKRSRALYISCVKDSICSKENEIYQLKETILGLSGKNKQHSEERLKNLQVQLQQYKNIEKVYSDEYMVKVLVGKGDIKEMQNNSSKFATELSQLI